MDSILLYLGRLAGQAAGWLHRARTKTKSEPGPRMICTKVAGVSFENEDGVSRQEIIKSLMLGHPVFLAVDPDNEHDPNAVSVWSTPLRQKLGYLPRRLAASIIITRPTEGCVVSITGRSYPLQGLIIEFPY